MRTVVLVVSLIVATPALAFAFSSSTGGGASAFGAAVASSTGGSITALGVAPSTPAVVDTCDLTAATGYTPVLHYAARLETGFANNDPATPLNDWGSQGDDISQGTGAAQPTYKASGPGGRPYISFDGGDFLESTSAITLNLTTFYICIVTNTGAAATTTESYFADDASTTRNISNLATPTFRASFGTARDTGTPSANTWKLVCNQVESAGTDEVWIDGALSLTGDQGANDIDRARLGANNTGGSLLTGAIAEFVLWTSDPNFDTVEAELESAACYGNNFPFAGTP